MSRNASFFDRWYAEMGCSGLRDQIVRQALRLPSGMDARGLLPWAGVTEVTAALNLAPGQLLVDLGCGRGGYSLEIARQTGDGRHRPGGMGLVGSRTANPLGGEVHRRSVT